MRKSQFAGHYFLFVFVCVSMYTGNFCVTFYLPSDSCLTNDNKIPFVENGK